jgi:hypothetical protein
MLKSLYQLRREQLAKGGPGSGRYPAGSGKGSEEVGTRHKTTMQERDAMFQDKDSGNAIIRKPNDWQEAKELGGFDAQGKFKNYIDKLPAIDMSGTTAFDAIDYKNNPQALLGEPFVARVDSDHYYVDPQGFNYPRYVAMLNGYSKTNKMVKGGVGSGRYPKGSGGQGEDKGKDSPKNIAESAGKVKDLAGKITTPDLSSVNLDNLDPLERMQYDHITASGKVSKEEALQVLINTTEGDFSQLSDDLRIRAEKDTTWNTGEQPGDTPLTASEKNYNDRKDSEEKGQADIDQSSIDETKLAYSDSVKQGDYSTRNLDWAGKETNANTYLEQAKIVGSYNEFDPDIAQEVVNTFGDKATYRMGREGSVVTYVKGGNFPVPTGTQEKLKADEFTHNQKTGEVRIWWD